MKSVTTTVLLGCVLPLASLVFTQARAETRGFLITSLAPAIYDDGEKSCPGGIVDAPDTAALLAKMSKSERESLVRYVNRPKLIGIACKAALTEQKKANEAQAKVPQIATGLKTVQGNVAYGFDLNRPHGKIPPAYSCDHENFVSPEGERGIDNQWYRAVGCLKTFHPGGLMYEYFNTGMREGEFSILVTIGGIDDPINDAEVQVGFYMAADPKAVARQPGSTKAGLRIHGDKYYQALARGRIVGGIVTTEPVHTRFQVSRLLHEFEVRDARVKLQLEPDGKLKGLLGGYQEIVFLTYWAINQHNEAAVPTGPTICPNFSPTIAALADGYPDPKQAGPCGWISVAYKFEAVPVKVMMQ